MTSMTLFYIFSPGLAQKAQKVVILTCLFGNHGTIGTAAGLASRENCGKFSATAPPGPVGVRPASPFISRKIPLRTYPLRNKNYLLRFSINNQRFCANSSLVK
jgi:hypothetical protein